MRSLIKSVLGLLPTVLSWPVHHLPQFLGSYTKVKVSGLGIQRAPEAWHQGEHSPPCFSHFEHISAACPWPELLRETSHSAPWPGSERTTTNSSIWKCVIRIGTTAGGMQCRILNYFCNCASVFKREKIITHNVSHFNFKRGRLNF